ncbi:hypothetical protein [Burkholderia stagnalis]|uniref:hypothetical protein n=1 Tax=Burkholderia stagnalis TaxID=1503054 RepID=UPI000B1F6445|nr:hypothetical protein [Burkholderia stagnalis]
MKPIAWMIMAACLALTACGGDDVATNGGASLSTPATPGTPPNPSPPTGGGPGGGGSQATAGWSNAAAMDGKAPEFEPSVTIDASGNALVSWTVAGMDAKGNITLVWGQLDVTGGKFLTTTMSQRYVSGTGWQTAQAVAPALAETSSFIGTPLLTVNETGMAAVMWPQLGGALQASVADATGNWGPLHQLTAHLDSTAGQYPPLVIDAAGNVTAAWQDVGASSSPAVVAASYRNGAWSASTLSGQDSQSAYWPALAVNAAGAMALVWASTVQNVGTLPHRRPGDDQVRRRPVRLRRRADQRMPGRGR